jgi:pyruvate decarboxylase
LQLHSTNTRIQYADYSGIGMKHLLPKLTAALEQFTESAKRLDVAPFTHPVPDEKSDIITHNWFWPRVGQFFRSKDIIVGETGTSSFGLVDIPASDSTLVLSAAVDGFSVPRGCYVCQPNSLG